MSDWSGEERRKNLIDIEYKLERLITWMGSEFGYNNQTKGNLYHHIERINASVKDVDKTVKFQNSRVNKLENWRSTILGAIGIIGMIIGFVGTIVFPMTVDSLRELRKDIKSNSEKIVRHLTNPNYHHNIVNSINGKTPGN